MMNEWKEYRLGDITEPLKEVYKPNGSEEVPYIGLEHIEQEQLRTNSIGKSSDVSSNKFKFSSNDILFGKLRPYFRKVVKPKFDGICSTDIWVFRAKKDFDQNFLFYFLANWDFVNLANSADSGTRMPRADWNFLKDTKWTLPSLPEQKAIAQVLSSLDDKIELLQKQNETLEKIGILVITKFFSNNNSTWIEKPFSDLLTITSSKRIFYSEYVADGIPFYRGKEIIELRNNGFTNSDLYISNEKYEEIKNKFGVPTEGDILLTSVGTLGIPFRVRKNDIFYFKDGNITWFKNFKELSSSIIYFWLLSKVGQEQLDSVVIGSTQQALTIEGLKRIKLKIQQNDELYSVKKETNSIIEKINNNQYQIKNLSKLRDTLLPKLMSGEARVMY